MDAAFTFYDLLSELAPAAIPADYFGLFGGRLVWPRG